MWYRKLFPGFSQFNRYKNVISKIIKDNSVTFHPMARLKT